MTGIFQGWRRTLSLVTLVLLCVLIAGWVRSNCVADKWILAAHKDGVDRIVATGGVVIWERITFFEPVGEIEHSTADIVRILDRDSERKRIVSWNVPRLGLSGGAYSLTQPIASDIAFLQVKYLAMILALILFTSLLIFLNALQSWISSRKSANSPRKRPV